MRTGWLGARAGHGVEVIVGTVYLGCTRARCQVVRGNHHRVSLVRCPQSGQIPLLARNNPGSDSYILVKCYTKRYNIINY